MPENHNIKKDRLPVGDFFIQVFRYAVTPRSNQAAPGSPSLPNRKFVYIIKQPLKANRETQASFRREEEASVNCLLTRLKGFLGQRARLAFLRIAFSHKRPKVAQHPFVTSIFSIRPALDGP